MKSEASIPVPDTLGALGIAIGTAVLGSDEVAVAVIGIDTFPIEVAETPGMATGVVPRVEVAIAAILVAVVPNAAVPVVGRLVADVPSAAEAIAEIPEDVVMGTGTPVVGRLDVVVPMGADGIAGIAVGVVPIPEVTIVGILLVGATYYFAQRVATLPVKSTGYVKLNDPVEDRFVADHLKKPTPL